MTLASKRGRPPKYGRPGRLLACTVPDDVREWLGTIHPDPGWALVSLFEGATDVAHPQPQRPLPAAQVALLVKRRGLIVVNRAVIPAIPGVVLIPLSKTQAFLTLDSGRGLADIELAVIDALDGAMTPENRQALEEFRELLRAWRKDPAWRFEPRTIVLAEHRGGRSTRRQPSSRRTRTPGA